MCVSIYLCVPVLFKCGTKLTVRVHVIISAGSTTYKALLDLLATLLVLKLLAYSRPEKFPLAFSPKICIMGTVESSVKKGVVVAVEFATQLDQMYPSLYARLELGYNWDSTLEDILYKCQVGQ